MRTDEGHASPGGSSRASTRAFGGASLARHDRLLGERYSDDLLSAAIS